jgi:hypothetical protein
MGLINDVTLLFLAPESEHLLPTEIVVEPSSCAEISIDHLVKSFPLNNDRILGFAQVEVTR